MRVRERAGLTEKFEGYRSTFRKVHFHLFRKFFLTKGSNVIGEHAAHALIGHSFYMDTYYRKSEEERRTDYLKLMPYLTVLSSHPAEIEDVSQRVNRQRCSGPWATLRRRWGRLKVQELRRRGSPETAQREALCHCNEQRTAAEGRCLSGCGEVDG